jgi:hypothetical protein
MKRKRTSKTKKACTSKAKTKKPVRKRAASKRKRTGMVKVSATRKAKMKKTIETLKNGLRELEKEVNRK